ncbi:SHOCT domain-containing protein [Clostridium nigeriense]|uniref:SHOCT domain-containing protein n=1 Tax=Clostridium nigeriense TaxID=1805470 RepID=UPI003D33431E
MLELKGKLGKKVMVDNNKVIINLGHLPFNKNREKTILINNIVSVEIKKPGLSSGFIFFQVMGEESKVRKSITDTSSDNEILFSGKDNYNIALQIKAYIDEFMSKDKRIVNAISVADEISKLKGLLDKGIINKEDFDKQKNKLLS